MRVHVADGHLVTDGRLVLIDWGTAGRVGG